MEFDKNQIEAIACRLDRIEQKLDLALQKLTNIQIIGAKLMSAGVTAAQALSDLQAQVAAETTVEQSAITLINGLAAQLAAAQGVSPSAVEAVIAQFQASAANLANAVTLNTPVSTAPAQVGTSVPTDQVKKA